MSDVTDPSHWGENGLVAAVTIAAKHFWDKWFEHENVKKLDAVVVALHAIQTDIAVIKAGLSDVTKLRQDHDQLRRDHDNLRTQVASLGVKGVGT